jgi:hypothetical protein
MPAMHEQAAESLLDRWMSIPEGPRALYDAYTGVRHGWGADYVDMLGQSARNWTMEQICCFAILHVDIILGKIAIVRVRAGGTPRSDADRTRNAELVADLPEPFTATVHMTQHGADADGTVSWDQPITVDVSPGPTDDGSSARAVPAIVPPGAVPMEIGYSLPSRTLLHIREDGGVARWPYGSDWIWVLLYPGFRVELDKHGLPLCSRDIPRQPRGEKGIGL